MLSEAYTKHPEDLAMEVERIKNDISDFGPMAYYHKSLSDFASKFPNFYKDCIQSFLKELDILEPGDSQEEINQYWLDGELIYPTDWDCLIEGAERLANGQHIQWEKIWKKYYNNWETDESLKLTEAAESDYVGKHAIFAGNDCIGDSSDWGYDSEDDFENEVLSYLDKPCTIDCLAVESDPESDEYFSDQYWDITFEDGHTLSAVSGYCLDLDDGAINESSEEDAQLDFKMPDEQEKKTYTSDEAYEIAETILADPRVQRMWVDENWCEGKVGSARISFDVDGDWRHDHGYFDSIVEDIIENKLGGSILSEYEKSKDDDNLESDSYKSTHFYVVRV